MVRNRGGTGPTSNRLVANRENETLAFGSYDAADGARATDTPGYHSRHNNWKLNISDENFRVLVNEVLAQHYVGKRQYQINKILVKEIGCPDVLKSLDLNWIMKQPAYDKIAKQAHSKYLSTLPGIQRRR